MRKNILNLLLTVFILSSLVSIAYAGSLDNEFPEKVKSKVDFKAHMFSLKNVRLLDGPFKDAMGRNGDYLLSLEPDRFLAWFRLRAGLEPKGEVYKGWESHTIAGHSCGHYLTACAMMYAATGEQEYKNRTDYMVDELDLVQKANGNGYMSAFRKGKETFEQVKRGEIRSKGFDLNGLWVPWYTQHKLIAGLCDIYDYTGNEKALKVCSKHVDWVYDTLKDLNEEQWQKMLACEHGGMNEALAQLYSLTGNKKYMELAKKFYHKSILDPLSKREDSLAGVHANTQVPKAIGAARIYELTADKKYHTIADYFWETVVNHYTYANGGNSCEEHFGKQDILGAKMNDSTETCNTYNMMKLTRHLYAWQPNASYMDYYERSVLNHILAHQHPEKGGALVYKGFLDMPARKHYSHPTENFWCCVGSGMENHTKYADTIYAHSDNTLYVNLFISSKLDWKNKGVKVTQLSDLPAGPNVKLSFECKEPTKISLKIRKPYWAKTISLAVNGTKQVVKVGPDGYVDLARTFNGGDIVELSMSMGFHVSRLPDMQNRAAILYGPTLMAAVLEENQKPPMLVSENAEAMFETFNQIKPLNYSASGIANYMKDNNWVPGDLQLLPIYQIAEQPYTVYMDTFTPEAWKAEQDEFTAKLAELRKLEESTVDFINLGQMQPERDHNLTGEKTEVGTFSGRKSRYSYNGWFEFDMKVLPDTPMSLACTYWGSERGRISFDILVDAAKIATQKLGNEKPGEFFLATYQIDAELTKGKEKVKVKFQAHPENSVGGVYDARIIKRN
ncbi:MAG: glycoside hydrolase family 127 protein [Planctomycetes bacterium]|nr:glycoside hydrolase family 127 protein [Planctomycetota bacterium]